MVRSSKRTIAGIVCTACALSLALTLTDATVMSVSASTISVLPSGGIGLSLETNATALENIAGSDTKNVRTSTVIAAAKEAAAQTEKAVAVVEAEPTEEDLFRNLVIAQVHNYVNVRSIPSEDGEIVGKLYDASVGNLLEEDNGWYKIESGSVTGYVKGEFCVTGEDAVELAKKVGTRLATVTTTTLKVRTQPGLDASVMGLVPIEDELVVSDEVDGWVQVDVEEGIGWVSTDYVTLHTEFVKAESKAEEEARLKKEAEEREKARRAAAAKSTKSSSTASQSASVFTAAVPSDGTMGAEVVNYALQFVGNPYVYGGSSLTQGTDCSGFVMSVYANFGVSLPHSSAADRSQGYAVDGGLENAQPGDIVCYSGHVAIYAGNGQIVHASTSKTGIIVSNADYKTPLAVRRIF